MLLEFASPQKSQASIVPENPFMIDVKTNFPKIAKYTVNTTQN